jgi:predicted Zn-dependent protease
MRVARIVTCLVAIAACAWFVLGIRQAHDLSSATSLISSGRVASDAQYERALALLRGARALNPDQEVNILRGEAALNHGDPQAAQRILWAVTRSEPRNLEAWLWLAKASNGNRQLVLGALTRVRALEPILPTS